MQLFKSITVSLFLLFLYPGNYFLMAQEENLNVFDRWIEWSDGNNMLIRHLNQQAFAYLDARDKEVQELHSSADWELRQEKVKNILLETVGPFPEKTPLNARITGVIQKDGFRIEKIIYESMPNFFVTACLLIPDGYNKKPAIIQVSGHGFPALRSPINQKEIYNLVKKGFIVFAIDPLGQGERIQYWDNEKKDSKIGNSTSEHSYFGNQMFLSGISPIRYFIWDGIRGIDYLITRKEVDPDRIGIYGVSGGGLQTTFISAFDDRIKAASPGCYISGFRRLIESIGAQDAEQNVYCIIKAGINQADLLQVRAPKSLLISSNTRDFFSIQGAIEIFNEVRMAYKVLGKEENAEQVLADAGHGIHINTNVPPYFVRNSENIYAFFQKVFMLPGTKEEVSFEGFKQEDLRVTPTGQLSTSLGGETAFSINDKESQKLLLKIKDSRNTPAQHLARVAEKAREISGYVAPPAEVKSVFRGRYQRDGYSVEMYGLHGEGEYVIPLLVFVPQNSGKFPAVIYMHPKGKITDASVGGKIEKLVKKGYLVVAPDLIGTGEVQDKSNTYEYAAQYLSVMIGRSITGIQAGDVIRVVNFLKSRFDVDQNKISAVAFDEMCPTLLHAAAFTNSIGSVALIGSLISYQTVVSNKYYDEGFIKYYVPAALTAYDLPDLIGLIAPRKIALVEVKNQLKEPVTKGIIDEELRFPKSVYSLKNSNSNINFIDSQEDLSSILKWCFQ